ncbi:hypothetical protein [Streptosporangium jomthongense]|uniref:Uncharacterized protein n=1 Tax=Streptosporangium jomthongense TaxID=1193683 RepID=A0ABV8F5Q9_9ACTN
MWADEALDYGMEPGDRRVISCVLMRKSAIAGKFGDHGPGLTNAKAARWLCSPPGRARNSRMISMLRYSAAIRGGPGMSERSTWTMHHFSQANPEGPEQGDVPALLRRVADSIEELGDVEVHDVIMHNEITEDGDWPSLTVYFDYRTDGA